MWLDFMIMKNVILAGIIITIQYPAASFAAELRKAGHNVAFTGMPGNQVTEEHPSFSGDAHTHKLSATQEKSTVFSRTRFQTTKRIPFPTTTIRLLPSETTDIQTSRKQSTDTIIPSMSTVVPNIQTSQIESTFPPMSTVGEETAATTTITTKSTTTTTATTTMATTTTEAALSTRIPSMSTQDESTFQELSTEHSTLEHISSIRPTTSPFQTSFKETTIQPLSTATTDIQTSRKQSTDTIIPSMSTVVPDIQTS